MQSNTLASACDLSHDWHDIVIDAMLNTADKYCEIKN